MLLPQKYFYQSVIRLVLIRRSILATKIFLSSILSKTNLFKQIIFKTKNLILMAKNLPNPTFSSGQITIKYI